MATEILIPDNDARKQYTATAGQTVFPYDFPIFDEDHLVVLHTVDATGVTTTLTITTDYTVSGVGLLAGGDVTLVSGAAEDDIITVYRDTPAERTTDYVDGGDYRAETINKDLDIQTMLSQERERDIARAFRLLPEDVAVDLLIPLLAARAGKYLVFDAGGNPAVASGTGNDTALRTDLAASGGAQLVGNPATGGLSGITVGDQLDELELEKAPLASPTFTGNVTLPTATAGGLFKFTKGGDLASANPLVIDTDGNYFDVAGTTNFASMTVGVGALFIVQFDDILTMTHHATNLNLPANGANITTAAGDRMLCFATGANTVHVISYTKADGTAVATYPSEVRLNTANGYGSTNNKIRRFTNATVNTGSDITYADSAADGASFTINADGLYAISFNDSFSGAGHSGISLNSTQLTTSITGITAADRLSVASASAANESNFSSVTLHLAATDVIRAHTSGVGAGTVLAGFTIVRVA